MIGSNKAIEWPPLAMAVMLFLLQLISAPTQAAVDKITSSTPVALQTSSRAFPEASLLDIGIPAFNDGLALTDEDDTVFPEVRYAESIYFANQLAKVLEKSGAWGAVRVTPHKDVITDVIVSGTIIQSDGETLELKITVTETSGQQWLAKTYRKVAGKLAYDRKTRSQLGDPFQNVFTTIANDMLAYREEIEDKEAATLRTISELRFAERFAPDAFADYTETSRGGVLQLKRLPAENDRLLQRVQKIRQRDYLYIDTMQDYYDEFSQNMHFAYQDFRRASYDSVVKARQLDQEGNRRIIAGIGSILAGIYGRTQSNSWQESYASTGVASAGGFILKSGLDKKQQSASYDESVAEMGSSLEADIAPQVITLEDRTVTLNGTVAAQYSQWQKLLSDIYQQERGTL